MADICPKCKKNPSDAGGKYCAECKERGREYVRRMRENRERDSVCIICGREKAMNGVKYCKMCATNCIESVESRREERDAGGLCIYCGKENIQFVHHGAFLQLPDEDVLIVEDTAA